MPTRPDLPSALLAGLSILFPVIAIVAIHTVGAGAAVVGMVVLLVARLALPVLRGVPLSLSLALFPVLIAVLAVAGFDRALSIRLYPAFMNAAMLAAFAVTLWKPPSMIERFARITEPNLPPSGVRYTRNVTWIWVAFFLLNGTIALWSAIQPGWAAWTYYNGFIAYAAAGALLVGEYLVRHSIIRWHGDQ